MMAKRPVAGLLRVLLALVALAGLLHLVGCDAEPGGAIAPSVEGASPNAPAPEAASPGSSGGA